MGIKFYQFHHLFFFLYKFIPQGISQNVFTTLFSKFATQLSFISKADSPVGFAKTVFHYFIVSGIKFATQYAIKFCILRIKNTPYFTNSSLTHSNRIILMVEV